LRDYGDISVIGVTEALRRLPAIRAALSAATERVSRPDVGAVLLVDFPDFNFRVGRRRRDAGSPSSTTSPRRCGPGAGRAKSLARFTKGAVVLFPFRGGVPSRERGQRRLRRASDPRRDRPVPRRASRTGTVRHPPGEARDRPDPRKPAGRSGRAPSCPARRRAPPPSTVSRSPLRLPVARPSLRDAIAREWGDRGFRSHWWTRSGNFSSGGWKRRWRFREPSRSSLPCSAPRRSSSTGPPG